MAVDVSLLNANSINNINTNFTRVKEALQEVVGRGGDLPNEMNADLDMDSNDILNVGTVDADVLIIGGEPVITNPLGSIPDNSIGPNQIIDGAVGTNELADGSVNNIKLSNDLTQRALMHFKLTGEYSPEMYGTIGISAANDTAAWVALSAAVTGLSNVRVVTHSPAYLIAGSGVVFNNVTSLDVDLKKSVFTQQNTFSKTLSFTNVPKSRVVGGIGVGKGTEYDGASSSYNGVAFMYFLNCDSVQVKDSEERLHAGGGYVVQGGRLRHFENIRCEGVGFPIIDPIGQGNQGNGSDFGIMCQPSALNNTQLFLFEDTFINCRVFNHAFGIQTCATKRLQIRGCDIGPCPGQHGVYAIDCDDIDVQANIFRSCRQFGFKQQYENYAGRFMAPAWAPSTAYAVGDKVIDTSTLYRCVTAHTSGASFNSTNWEIDTLFRRNGGVLSNNIFDGKNYPQSQAIGFISTTLSDGRSIYTTNLIVGDNVVRNHQLQAFYLDRLLDCDIINNILTDNVHVGMFLRDFRGRVKGNFFRKNGLVPVEAKLSGDMWFEDNKAFDCSMAWAGAVTSTFGASILSVTGRTTLTTIPDMPTTRFCYFYRNEIRFSQTESPGSYHFFSEEDDVYWFVHETRCSISSTKTGRINGGTDRLADQYRNDFVSAGYVNTAQNETVPTDAATLITNLRAKRVIK